jgi:transcriptional regulator with XRE-family HTH domain
MKSHEEKPPHPLKQWRELNGLSQTQLAAACDLDQTAVSHYELYARTPRGEALRRLQEVTQLPLAALVMPEDFLAEFRAQHRRPWKPPRLPESHPLKAIKAAPRGRPPKA